MAELQVRTDVPGEFLNVHGHTLRRQLNQSLVAQLGVLALSIVIMVFLILVNNKPGCGSCLESVASIASVSTGTLYQSQQDGKCQNTAWYQPGCTGLKLLRGSGLAERRVALTVADCVPSSSDLSSTFAAFQTPQVDATCQRITRLERYSIRSSFTHDSSAVLLLNRSVAASDAATAVAIDVPEDLRSWIQSIVTDLQ